MRINGLITLTNSDSSFCVIRGAHGGRARGVLRDNPLNVLTTSAFRVSPLRFPNRRERHIEATRSRAARVKSRSPCRDQAWSADLPVHGGPLVRGWASEPRLALCVKSAIAREESREHVRDQIRDQFALRICRLVDFGV